MTVTERLRQPGSWNLKLSDATPVSVRQELAFAGHIVITPTHVRPEAVGDAAMLAMARYTGPLLRRKRASTELSGQGLALWLGSDELGELIESPISRTNGTLAQWIGDLIPTSELTVGTVTDPGGTLTWTVAYTQRFKALEYVCTYFGVDWRINPNGTIDVGANLFVTTPTCIAIRRGGGADISIRGLHVEDIELDEDIETYTTRVFLLGAGEASSVATGSADISPATPYKGFKGNAIKRARLVDASETPSGQENTIAGKVLAQHSATHPALALSTDTYDVGGKAKPGDLMWVFDHLEGLYDAANEVRYRGQILHPAKLKVYGYTWPAERGMGVYFRRWVSGVATYTDLTPYHVAETGSTRFEVGGERRLERDVGGAVGNVTIERTERPDAPPAGTISHNDLSGVTADQHHAQAHAIGGADHTGTLAHSALGSVGADDHHAKAHVHLGDGSGTVDHGSLAGLGDDDHPQYATNADLTAHEGAADPHSGYVQESLFDAKGDLLAASADNTPSRVSVGSNGQFLKADSSLAAGVGWFTHADADHANVAPTASAPGDASVSGTVATHKHARETRTRKAAGPVGTGASTSGTDLLTVSIPSGALAVGSIVRAVASVNITGTNGRRIFGFSIAGSAVALVDSDVDGTVSADWLCELTLHVISTSAVWWAMKMQRAAKVVPICEAGTLATNATTGLSVRVYGHTLNAADEITANYLTTDEAA